ncbi:MAG: hypothetical protein AAFV53_25365, partial [Myxococcota bacterium]
ADALCDRVEAHIRLDDAILAPELEMTDAWRTLRLCRLALHHKRQRAAMERIRRADAAGLSQAIAELAEALRDDFAEETRLMLNPDVLRDDLVTIAPSA